MPCACGHACWDHYHEGVPGRCKGVDQDALGRWVDCDCRAFEAASR